MPTSAANLVCLHECLQRSLASIVGELDPRHPNQPQQGSNNAPNFAEHLQVVQLYHSMEEHLYNGILKGLPVRPPVAGFTDPGDPERGGVKSEEPVPSSPGTARLEQPQPQPPLPQFSMDHSTFLPSPANEEEARVALQRLRAGQQLFTPELALGRHLQGGGSSSSSTAYAQFVELRKRTMGPRVSEHQHQVAYQKYTKTVLRIAEAERQRKLAILALFDSGARHQVHRMPAREMMARLRGVDQLIAQALRVVHEHHGLLPPSAGSMPRHPQQQPQHFAHQQQHQQIQSAHLMKLEMVHHPTPNPVSSGPLVPVGTPVAAMAALAVGTPGHNGSCESGGFSPIAWSTATSYHTQLPQPMISGNVNNHPPPRQLWPTPVGSPQIMARPPHSNEGTPVSSNFFHHAFSLGYPTSPSPHLLPHAFPGSAAALPAVTIAMSVENSPNFRSTPLQMHMGNNSTSPSPIPMPTAVSSASSGGTMPRHHPNHRPSPPKLLSSSGRPGLPPVVMPMDQSAFLAQSSEARMALAALSAAHSASSPSTPQSRSAVARALVPTPRRPGRLPAPMQIDHCGEGTDQNESLNHQLQQRKMSSAASTTIGASSRSRGRDKEIKGTAEDDSDDEDEEWVPGMDLGTPCHPRGSSGSASRKSGNGGSSKRQLVLSAPSSPRQSRRREAEVYSSSPSPSSAGATPRSELGNGVLDLDRLMAWLWENFEDPYPTEAEREELSQRCQGTSAKQVNFFFINARVRLCKPLLETMELMHQLMTHPPDVQHD